MCSDIQKRMFYLWGTKLKKMGVHLWVSRVLGTEVEELCNGQEGMYYHTESQNWFDSLRYSGDKDFILKVDFTACDTGRTVEEQRLFRPANFDDARKWVKENVVKGNQLRLLVALNRMEMEPDLAFSWSW